MTIYEKNIHTLAKYYPGMDHNIEKARKELKEELDLIEELSADGEPILKIKKINPQKKQTPTKNKLFFF